MIIIFSVIGRFALSQNGTVDESGVSVATFDNVEKKTVWDKGIWENIGDIWDMIRDKVDKSDKEFVYNFLKDPNNSEKVTNKIAEYVSESVNPLSVGDIAQNLPGSTTQKILLLLMTALAAPVASGGDDGDDDAVVKNYGDVGAIDETDPFWQE